MVLAIITNNLCKGELLYEEEPIAGINPVLGDLDGGGSVVHWITQ